MLGMKSSHFRHVRHEEGDHICVYMTAETRVVVQCPSQLYPGAKYFGEIFNVDNNSIQFFIIYVLSQQL
jgi:hypothetical protein